MIRVRTSGKCDKPVCYTLDHRTSKYKKKKDRRGWRIREIHATLGVLTPAWTLTGQVNRYYRKTDLTHVLEHHTITRVSQSHVDPSCDRQYIEEKITSHNKRIRSEVLIHRVYFLTTNK